MLIEDLNFTVKMERTPAGIDRSLYNEFVDETPLTRKDMMTMFQQVLMEALPDLAEQIKSSILNDVTFNSPLPTTVFNTPIPQVLNQQPVPMDLPTIQLLSSPTPIPPSILAVAPTAIIGKDKKVPRAEYRRVPINLKYRGW